MLFLSASQLNQCDVHCLQHCFCKRSEGLGLQPAEKTADTEGV